MSIPLQGRWDSNRDQFLCVRFIDIFHLRIKSWKNHLNKLISRLSDSIKEAKQKCHFPSRHGLTIDQSAAIYIYSMEWDEERLYRLLNQALTSQNRQPLQN